MSETTKFRISVNIKLGAAIVCMTLLIIFSITAGYFSTKFLNAANAVTVKRTQAIGYSEKCALMPYELSAIFADALINENFTENANDFSRVQNDWQQVTKQLRDTLEIKADIDLFAAEDPTLEALLASYDKWVSLVQTGDREALAVMDKDLDLQREAYALSVELLRDNLMSERDDANRKLDSVISGVRVTQIILLCISILLGFVVYYILLKTVVLPVRKVASLLKNISEGDGDLTQTISIKSKDEIGDLAGSFNLTIEKIRGLIIAIKAQAHNLSYVGSELASNMAQTAAAVNQISANIQSIKNQTVNQAASVTETNSTMAQISQNIGKLDGLITDQSSNITQSSSAIEEMLANIASVSQTLERNAENVQELSAASGSGRENLNAVSAQIREVAKESDGLLEISAVIQSIASQTNLLSMNAAIEAAHAGDSGRGFSVVADEIRKLAETSGTQAKTVSVVLKRIKASMDAITSATEKVMRQFDDIARKIDSVAERELSIKNAMDEQGEGSKQILEAVGQLNSITGSVKSGSVEMLTGSSEVIRESENLGRITGEVSGSMNEMASGVQEITVAVNKVNDISQENKQSIDALLREVGAFKVE
jgi:methyl-accepting chemotaxis protein